MDDVDSGQKGYINISSSLAARVSLLIEPGEMGKDFGLGQYLSLNRSDPEKRDGQAGKGHISGGKYPIREFVKQQARN